MCDKSILYRGGLVFKHRFIYNIFHMFVKHNKGEMTAAGKICNSGQNYMHAWKNIYRALTIECGRRIQCLHMIFQSILAFICTDEFNFQL